jgi:hypothetical protein
MIEFVYSATPLSRNDLDDFEREFKIVFPSEFRDLYLRANGGKPNRRLFVDENGPCKIQTVLPIKYSSIPGLSTLNQSFYHLKVQAHLLPDHLVPFAVDPLGGYFCFSVKDDCVGSIWLVHMDGSGGPEFLSPNLTDFFSQLK